MRIGINLLYLIPGHVGGTQTYAESLLDALITLDTNNEYYLFLNQESRALRFSDAAHVRKIYCNTKATRRAVRYAWEQFILPIQLEYYKIDVIHSLGYVGPLTTTCPTVVTIHDINYVGWGHLMSPPRRLILKAFVERTARYANHILTDSYFAKGEIVKYTGVLAEKITVAYLGPRAQSSTFTPESCDAIVATYQLSQPYLMAFGSLSPHKNILRLVQAFARIAVQMPHQLVLVGHLLEDTAVHEEIIRLGLQERVIMTGYVPDSHVLPLLAHADLFVFPSLYEGFGLPILDAQSVGVPVACSHVASLPEIAGAGALLFDPYSVEEIAQILQAGLLDPAQRTMLIQKGAENVHRFSWQQTARQTLDVYSSLRES